MQSSNGKKPLLGKVTSVIIVSIVVVLVLALVITVLPNRPINSNQIFPGEIRQYQGQNLSAINDFVENSIKGPQHVEVATYHLAITGLVNKTVSYTYDDIIHNFTSYKKVLTLRCVEGWSVTILWEGFLVSDLLKEAGVGSNAVGVIFHGYDGYTTELPLSYLYNSNIMVAYKMNNVTLPPQRGFPFELVAENQAGYKWIKWITEMELTDNPNYLGFWESHGYPNNATIPSS
jgi:DMSO/TMAO reductase YedYZ molybdopterin-dependent catalytic subunit